MKQRNCKKCGKPLGEMGSDTDEEYADGYCAKCYEPDENIEETLNVNELKDILEKHFGREVMIQEIDRRHVGFGGSLEMKIQLSKPSTPPQDEVAKKTGEAYEKLQEMKVSGVYYSDGSHWGIDTTSCLEAIQKTREEIAREIIASDNKSKIRKDQLLWLVNEKDKEIAQLKARVDGVPPQPQVVKAEDLSEEKRNKYLPKAVRDITPATLEEFEEALEKEENEFVNGLVEGYRESCEKCKGQDDVCQLHFGVIQAERATFYYNKLIELYRGQGLKGQEGRGNQRGFSQAISEVRELIETEIAYARKHSLHFNRFRCRILKKLDDKKFGGVKP